MWIISKWAIKSKNQKKKKKSKPLRIVRTHRRMAVFVGRYTTHIEQLNYDVCFFVMSKER